ncbi:ABC transporter ATP-binding protein [Liquorilactobacillus capillatus]|uniref:ABC transporter, ATP-binding protein n=1 Tax=Liquorilactobacillus capillatus DSM 19910 TaxID=1423731 RepID=A0A0R1LXR0_9LACO|nr:ABC transporter ATP-binding protein [Liquorilactobacillus capillatus]KRL00509.1 ABC transporter, ATP-binding protein [Liquorilactobacillus capillatus DSM 19910]
MTNETNYILATDHLAKKFGKQEVLHDVSLKIAPGDIYGFLGVNGAGKSTTMKLLLGLLQPDAGNIEIFGQALNTNRNEILKQIGALIEEPSFYPNLTGAENLNLIKNLLELPAKNVDKVLKIVSLENAKDKLVQNYSLGMKQRLAIAMALIKFPKLLILDEPTNGLDPEGMHQMRELIKSLPTKYGITVLISSHLLSEMSQMAHTVGIIKDGNLIYQGSMDSLTGKQKYFLKTDNKVIAKQIVAKYTGTDILESQSHVLTFNLGDPQLTASIIKALVNAGVSVYSLYGKKKSLEDVFLDLTGSADR